LAFSPSTVRDEDQQHLWTRAGLAAHFGISEETIKHYIACDRVPPALGKHPNGFNYNHTHFHALRRVRAEMESRTPLVRRRKQRPHCVQVHAREAAVA
jgi:hypothetical protein